MSEILDTNSDYVSDSVRWALKVVESSTIAQGDTNLSLAFTRIRPAAPAGDRWLQSYIDEYGGIVLHNGGIREHSFSGLGLKNTGRTLTQAIDEARIVPEQDGSS